MTTTTTVAPAIWIADLAAYNAGILHGEWVRLDADTTIDELDATVKRILAEGTRRYCRETLSAEHEEFAIHDYEGFGPIRIGEYSSLSSVLGHVHRMADDPARYFAFIDAMGSDYADEYESHEVYGPYDSLEDYAWNEFDEIALNHMGPGDGLQEFLTQNGMPDGFARCVRFDAEQFVRDAQASGLSYGQYDGKFYIVEER